MKLPRVFLVCFVAAVFSGCSAFKTPSASQQRRYERSVLNSESQRAQDDRERAIDNRAAAYQRQGMNEAQARSAAAAESTGPKKSWP